MKDALSEIKNNLQGKNSRVDEANNKINDLKHKEAKNNQSEYHPPASAELILLRGRKLVVGGHSQSLQLIGLGKYLPLICQQQPSLNYKKKVYSAHRKGTTGVPSLGERGG